MNNKKLCKEFVTAPAVFAVEDTYQIMVPVRCAMLFWVEIGGEKYYDHSNGILRSATRIHRVTVPMEALNSAGAYTVCFRNVTDRKPYFPETEETKTQAFRFYPVRDTGAIHIYHISDTHGNDAFAAKAGAFFGDELDLLVLNGDILDHSGSEENLLLTYRLCDAITHGAHPCVFSRGNHDLRGVYAEQLAEYCPSRHGKSYYTFRLGSIWGVVMDCGEDKSDGHAEYGGTVCCDAFRKEETRFLKAVTERREYLAPGIRYRFVIVHNPFTHTLEPPFDIEQERYQEWTDILKQGIKPHAMLAGHLHEACVSRVGGALDSKGQPCPVIIGSKAVKDKEERVVDFIGCALTLDGEKTEVRFTDAAHTVRACEQMIL